MIKRNGLSRFMDYNIKCEMRVLVAQMYVRNDVCKHQDRMEKDRYGAIG